MSKGPARTARRDSRPLVRRLLGAVQPRLPLLFAAGVVAACFWAVTHLNGEPDWAAMECRDRYARAATRADTAAVDRHPVAVRKRGPLYCYKFRLGTAGLRRPLPAPSPPH